MGHSLKIGDRVKWIGRAASGYDPGDGTVVRIGKRVSVAWDNFQPKPGDPRPWHDTRSKIRHHTAKDLEIIASAD